MIAMSLRRMLAYQLAASVIALEAAQAGDTLTQRRAEIAQRWWGRLIRRRCRT